MKVSELLEVSGGRLLYGNRNTEMAALALSSKEVKKGDCFVAVKGEKTDGNNFIEEAIEKGAVIILSDRHPVTYGGLYGLVERIREGNVSFVLVEDIYKAVKSVAKYYREKYLESVVAVTGSVGKTTVKELIYSVLSERIDIYKTEGNKNNHLGLPLSIISGNKSKNAVLELGISNFNEMNELSLIATPNVSVITNIGVAHIEFLLSRENIAAEKLKIINGMKNGGFLIINGDEPLLTAVKNKADSGDFAPEGVCAVKILTVSEKNQSSDYYVYNVSYSDGGTFFDIRERGKALYDGLYVPITGKHGALDAAFAVAVARLFGCDEENVRNGFKKFSPCGDRQRLENIRGINCIFDCYNASPESFAASLDAFNILSERKNANAKAIVAGSMLELGKESEKEHRKLGKLIADCSPKLLITVGEEALFVAEGAKAGGMKDENIFSYPDQTQVETVAEEIKKRLSSDSFLLIKGSRALRLEQLRDYLK